MKELYGEGLASHTDPESCASSRKAGREALTGAHADGVLSREMAGNQDADLVYSWGRQHWWMRHREHPLDLRGLRPPICTALFEGDLLALVDHLKLEEVRLVAQSMGGWTCLNFTLSHPRRVLALVMASTGGAVDPHSFDAVDRKNIESWSDAHRGMQAELVKRGIHPDAGERMAREQPALEFLYREIDRLSIDLDKARQT